MRFMRAAWTVLLISFMLAASGMYGCSAHEYARQGLAQDDVTHSFAGIAYLGFTGMLVSVLALLWSLFAPSKVKQG
jgi:uncharacterized membrane protein